jgi:mannose-6-phosphate isomerase class I
VESLGVQGFGPCVVVVESGSYTLHDGDQKCALDQGLAYAWLPEAATASLRGAGSVFVVVPA